MITLHGSQRAELDGCPKVLTRGECDQCGEFEVMSSSLDEAHCPWCGESRKVLVDLRPSSAG